MRLALPQSKVGEKVGVLAGGHLNVGITVEEQEQGILALDGEGDALDAGREGGHFLEGFQTFRLKRYSQR
jgi:hypothetical protein